MIKQIPEWPTWDDLITLWKIGDVQLYDLLKQGLQPYNKYTGKKYVDEDFLERAPRDSLEFIENTLRAGYKASRHSGPHTWEPITDDEIKTEALQEHNARPKEIVNRPKNRHIISYTLSLNVETAKQQIAYARENFMFESGNVLEVARKHDLPLSDETTSQRTDKEGKAIFPCKAGTKWEDITMTLVADDMLRIKTPQGEGQFTYHQLGMRDIRKGDKPTMLWGLIKLFAKMDGFISSQNPDYDPKLPDTAKRLNYHLQELFGIDETIYTGHYKKEKGYRTRIKFYDRTF